MISCNWNSNLNNSNKLFNHNIFVVNWNWNFNLNIAIMNNWSLQTYWDIINESWNSLTDKNGKIDDKEVYFRNCNE